MRSQLKDETNKVFYDKFGLVFIEIPSFVKTVDELETHRDRGLYFLKHAGALDATPTIFKDDGVERAFTMAELYALSPEDRQRYADIRRTSNDWRECPGWFRDRYHPDLIWNKS